jgi:hypothetical protein
MPRNIYKGGRPDDYSIGRGRLLLADAVLYSGSVAQVLPDRVYRDIGNCTSFSLSQESETKEHTSFLQGLATKDIELVVSTKMSISFQVDEVSMANMARFVSGEVWGFETGNAVFNAAAVVSTLVPGAENYFIDTAATDFVFDQWYPMTLDLGGGPILAFDFEAQATQAITVRKNPTTRTSTDGTVLTEGTHYEIDRKAGMIRFAAVAGGLARGDVFRVSWAAPGTAKNPTSLSPGVDDELNVVPLLTNSGRTVALRFIGENPNANNQVTVFDAWAVKLRPDGEMSLIGDDWSTLGFTGALQSVANPPVQSSPYGRISRRNVYSTT